MEKYNFLSKLIIKIIYICGICQKLVLQNPIKNLRLRNYIYMLLFVYFMILTENANSDTSCLN